MVTKVPYNHTSCTYLNVSHFLQAVPLTLHLVVPNNNVFSKNHTSAPVTSLMFSLLRMLFPPSFAYSHLVFKIQMLEHRLTQESFLHTDVQG